MGLKFSQRIGKTLIRNALQDEGMDEALRAGLWNSFCGIFIQSMPNLYEFIWTHFFERMWRNHFKRPIDSDGDNWKKVDVVRKVFLEGEWHEVYDLVEYLAGGPEDSSEYPGSPSRFIKECNGILKREMSAYRIVGNQVMRTTDPQEIEAIEVAVSQRGPWATSAKHLSNAAAFLFNRTSPNYSSSMHEAMSAVESACRVVTGDARKPFANALEEIEKSHGLHGALKGAFSKLYGYTSDAGGIRHGSINMADVTFEEAKFMLVACSAFVNYLKGISAGTSSAK